MSCRVLKFLEGNTSYGMKLLKDDQMSFDCDAEKVKENLRKILD